MDDVSTVEVLGPKKPVLLDVSLVGLAGGPVGEKGLIVTREAQQRYTAERIEDLEGKVLVHEQTEVPLTHRFAPGLYIREGIMPKGHFILGHCHKTEHFNLALSGSASVMMDGVVHFIKAPALIKSAPGVRKIFFIHEDLHWATIHPTNTTDIAQLEEELVIHSDTFKEHELKALQKAVET